MQNNDIAIFWGSQSGVSERFAERLAREWHSRFALKVLLADLDDYDPHHLATFPRDKLAVFLISTFGEGDPPDNAVEFCSGLEKMRKKGTKLENLRYLAMGMGNSNYKHYNRVIKLVDETLSTLGAQRIGPVGFADESQGPPEESFMDWKEEVLEPLSAIIALNERPITYEPSLDILDACVDDHLVYLGEPSDKALCETREPVAYNSQNPYAAPIALSTTLSAIPNRVCAHMEFSLSAAPALRYQTGDHLAVWPVNPENEVDRLMNLIGLDETQRKRPILIETKSGNTNKPTIPLPTTRESLLKYYLEIGALPSRDSLVLLSQYAPTEAASAALLRLGKDKAAFRTKVAVRHRSIGKVLESISPTPGSWGNVPFSLLVESFRRIQPRSYSISSSPLVQPRQPSITMVVNNKQIQDPDDAKQEDRFHGLATNFLLAHNGDFAARGQARLLLPQRNAPPSSDDGPEYDLNGPRGKLSGAKVYMHIKRSTFKLPPNAATPVIMVAAGTGVAPFRGFVQERARLVELGKRVGTMVLFFGCRDDSTDFLYRDEWRDFQAKLGDGFVLVNAFSRMPGRRKMYVQDALAERGELVGRLVDNEGAAFYICGAASMAREVRERLVVLLAEKRGCGREEADKKISGKMKKEGLYYEDVWG